MSFNNISSLKIILSTWYLSTFNLIPYKSTNLLFCTKNELGDSMLETLMFEKSEVFRKAQSALTSSFLFTLSLILLDCSEMR